MIEPTAVVMGDSKIDPTTYVGHYVLIGTPFPAGMFGRSTERTTVWEPSRGVSLRSQCVVGHHTIIDDGTDIGDEVWIGSNVRIGHDCQIGNRVQIYYCAQVYDRVRLDNDSWVGGFLCNDSVVEEGAIVLGSLVHRFINATVGIPEPAPRICHRAFVGMGALIVGGVTVGSKSYIAAGCVLTVDAEPGRLYVGNPARDAGPAPDPLATQGLVKNDHSD